MNLKLKNDEYSIKFRPNEAFEIWNLKDLLRLAWIGAICATLSKF